MLSTTKQGVPQYCDSSNSGGLLNLGLANCDHINLLNARDAESNRMVKGHHARNWKQGTWEECTAYDAADMCRTGKLHRKHHHISYPKCDDCEKHPEPTYECASFEDLSKAGLLNLDPSSELCRMSYFAGFTSLTLFLFNLQTATTSTSSLPKRT